MEGLPERTPQAYGYARVSHVTQATRDESIPAQVERIKQFYDLILKPDGVQWQDVDFDSTGVSAYSKPFDQRPAGKRLIDKLRPGDHLIVDRLDRICRSVKDASLLVDWLQKHDINFQVISPRIDTTGPAGMLTFNVLCAVAQFESDLKRQRSLERAAYAAKHGRPYGHPPMGTKVEKRNGKRVLAWDLGMRAVMAHIVVLRRRGLTWEEVSVEIERHMAHSHGRAVSDKSIRSAFYRRRWWPMSCRRAFMVEVYLQDNGIHDVTDIPVKLISKAEEYCNKIGLNGRQ